MPLQQIEAAPLAEQRKDDRSLSSFWFESSVPEPVWIDHSDCLPRGSRKRQLLVTICLDRSTTLGTLHALLLLLF